MVRTMPKSGNVVSMAASLNEKTNILSLLQKD